MELEKDTYLHLIKLQEQQLEQVRVLRNSVRSNMTRNKKIISSKDQIKWFNSLDEYTKVYVLIECAYGAVFQFIGYGIVSYNKDYTESNLTGVIDDSYRGKGYGRKLFSMLIDESKQKCSKVKLEVLETNFVARNLYKSLGFEEVSSDLGIVYMEIM